MAAQNEPSSDTTTIEIEVPDGEAGGTGAGDPGAQPPSVEEPDSQTPGDIPEDRDDAPVDELPTLEEEPLEPETQSLMAGTSATEAGNVFINTETTRSSAPNVDTQTGSLKYEYALVVPPGRGSMTPDLRLSYSSNDVDNTNVYGYGWSDSIPSIKRANKHGSNELYASNEFYSTLDGELVQVASTTYQPRVESGSFRTYSLENDAWTVLEKDSTTLTFGSTTAARRDNPADSSKIYSWQLEESRDANGNYINYQYYKDAGQIYPQTIIYSGNGTTTGALTIDFSRQSRSDNLVSSETGFVSTTTYRINSIQASVSGSWVFTYDLAYAAGHNGLRSLLTSVTKSGRDEAGTVTALPSTNFTYETYSSSNKTWQQDTGINVPVNIVRQKAGYDDGARFVDINGDTLPDIVQSWNTDFIPGNPASAQQAVYLNTGSGWATTTAWTIPKPYNGRFGFVAGYVPVDSSYASSADLGERFADVNNDGFADILWGYSISHTDMSYSYSYTIRDVYLNNGVDGWATSTDWTLPSDIEFVHDARDSGSRIADVNGDHLPDLLSVTSSQNKVYLNTGAGWSLASTSWAIPEPFLNGQADAGTRLADVNGDGLTDVLRAHTTDTPAQSVAVNKVYLNIGNGWKIASTTNWIVPVPFTHYRYQVGTLTDSTHLIDVNSDGLTDLIRSSGNGSSADDGNDVYINTGEGWIQDSNGTVPPAFKFGYTSSGYKYTEAGVAEMDVDGDNMIDFVKSGPTSAVDGHEKWVYLHKAKVPDLLSSITYPEGGEIGVAYKQSALYKDGPDYLNPGLSSNLNTVNEVSYDDSVTDAYTHTYTYGGGLTYFASSTDTQFAGFATTTIEDGRGNVTTTYIHQGDDSQSSLGEYNDSFEKMGKPYLSETRNNEGDLYSRTINRWDSQSIGTTSAFVYPTREVTQDFDGNSDQKDTATEYAYDSVGNLLTQTEWGEVTASTTDGSFTDVGNDKRTTTYAYASSTGPRVLNAVSGEQVTDQSAARVRESKYFYDNLSSGSVGNGNRTKRQDWIDSNNYADTSWLYNGYGLITQTVNPRGATTTYAYDSYNLYPATTTDALLHATVHTYDYSSGKVKTTKDPNGYTTHNTYDGLDRVLTLNIPDPIIGSTTLSVRTTYHDSRNHFYTELNKYLTATSSVDSYTYLDGFGRKVQQRNSAEDADIYVVRDWEYGQDALLHAESLPYFGENEDDSNPTDTDELWITYEYDPLNRQVSVENAVGTTDIEYDQWTQTATDPLEHEKSYGYDAYKQLVLVYEHNATSTYATEYGWDTNGNLSKITDALGNIRTMTYDGLSRRTSAEDLHDTGDGTFGTWSYEYDTAGNLSQSTSPNGALIQNTYDLLNRQLTEDYTGTGGTEESYAYDSCTNGVGFLCSATTTGAVSTYTYTPDGLLKSETKTISGTPYTTQYAYDLAGNKMEITYPDSSAVRYTYNKGGYTETIDQKENGGAYASVVTDLDYGPNGLMTYRNNANGTFAHNVYDPDALYRLTRKTLNKIPEDDSESFSMMRSGEDPELTLQEAPYDVSSLFTKEGQLSAELISDSSAAMPHILPPEPITKENAKILADENLVTLKSLPVTAKELQLKAPIERHLGMVVANGMVKYAYRTDTKVDELPLDEATIRQTQEAGIILGQENAEKRTKFARTFATSKPGIFVTEIVSGDPQYYEDEQGEWWLADYGITTKASFDHQIEAARQVKEEPGFIDTLVQDVLSLFMPARAYASTGSFYPDASPGTTTFDGYLYKEDSSTWSTVHNASASNLGSDSSTQIEVLDQHGTPSSSSRKGIKRGFLLFDTSAIPDAAAIMSASLDLYIKSVTAASSVKTLYLVSSDPDYIPHINNNDYDQIGTWGSNPEYGHSDGTYTNNAYESIPFDSWGMDNVAKTGITMLGLRTHNDLRNITSTNSNELTVAFSASEQTGTSEDPKLVVIYNQTPGVAVSLETEGSANPADVPDTKPEFSAVFADPDSGDVATAYQIQVALSPSDFSVPIWDSGKATLSLQTANGYRSESLQYEGKVLSPGITYYWRMRFWDSLDTNSSWSTTTASFSIVNPTPLMDDVYTYDAVGNITSITDIRDLAHPVAKVYEYDDLNRLISVGTTTATLDFPEVDGMGTTTQVITIQPDSTDGKDTTYGTVSLTTGSPNGTGARIGGNGDEYFSYFQFPLDAIEDLDAITTAQLYLFNNKSTWANDAKAMRITQSWAESGVTATSSPTAAEYGSWQSVPNNGWWVTDVTQLTEDWQDSIYPNYGVKILGSTLGGHDYTKEFWTSDYTTDITKRPKLVVSGIVNVADDLTPAIPRVTVVGTTTITNTYSYDAIGNMLSSLEQGSYAYDETGYANPHAVTGIASSTTYSYDHNGNLTGYTGGNTLTWDYKNQLSALTVSPASASYTYDHTRVRTSKTVGAVTTAYPNNLYEKTGTSTLKHIYLGDELIGTMDGSGTTTASMTYAQLDHLGSTRLVTDSTGQVIQTLDYAPFGAQTEDMASTSFSQTNRFIGENFDPESSFSYLNTRYYEGSRGQFLSQDPVFWEVGQTEDGIATLSNPQLLNSYSYAGNNPITYKDPDGRFIPALVLGGLAFYGGYTAGTDLYQGYTNGNSGQFALGAFGAVTSIVPGGGAEKGAVSAAEAAAKYSVYVGRDADDAVRYVGITSRDVAKRAQEHLKAIGTGKESLTYSGLEGASTLTKNTARSIEQAGIDIGGMVKNGGQLLNKVNSIAASKISNIANQSNLNKLSGALKQLQKSITKLNSSK